MSKSLRLALFGGLTLFVILVDQWVKFAVRSGLRPGESWRGGPIPGVFEVTLTFNRGVAFGALEGKAFLAIPIALGITIACALSAAKPTSGRFKIVSLGLLASGAIGNLIDRIIDSRGVTDMFLLRLANLTGGKIGDFPVFNVADAAITVAVVMLAIVWLREAQHEKHVAAIPATTENANP